jgi:hypothetical protein
VEFHGLDQLHVFLGRAAPTLVLIILNVFQVLVLEAEVLQPVQLYPLQLESVPLQQAQRPQHLQGGALFRRHTNGHRRARWRARSQG